jgi:hypothetical protein
MVVTSARSLTSTTRTEEPAPSHRGEGDGTKEGAETHKLSFGPFVSLRVTTLLSARPPVRPSAYRPPAFIAVRMATGARSIRRRITPRSDSLSKGEVARISARCPNSHT